MDRELIEEMKALMVARREDLTRLREDSEQARGTVELDQTSVGRLSRMDALQGQQMALAQDRSREAELNRIDAALRRIEDGTYGFCLACEEEIAAKRLRFDPASPLCIGCAR